MSTDDTGRPSPTEVRDLLAVLAKGVLRDIESADPSAFAPLADDPTDEDRKIRQGVQLLSELVFCSSFIAGGLRGLDFREKNACIGMMDSGISRLTRGGMVRHLIEGCPAVTGPPATGHPDTTDDDATASS